MPRVMWPDGTTTRAATWDELETKLRNLQWYEFSARKFRREMRRRAKMWSGTRISIRGDAEAFFRELERAEMLRIVVGVQS